METASESIQTSLHEFGKGMTSRSARRDESWIAGLRIGGAVGIREWLRISVLLEVSGNGWDNRSTGVLGTVGTTVLRDVSYNANHVSRDGAIEVEPALLEHLEHLPVLGGDFSNDSMNPPRVANHKTLVGQYPP